MRAGISFVFFLFPSKESKALSVQEALSNIRDNCQMRFLILISGTTILLIQAIICDALPVQQVTR